jgi:hypothetical protein
MALVTIELLLYEDADPHDMARRMRNLGAGAARGARR